MLKGFLKSLPVVRQLNEMLQPHKFVACRKGERFGLFNRQTQQLLGGFAIGPADTVVDVGCVACCASVFASDCGAEVYAVDIDPRALAAVDKRRQGCKRLRPFPTLLSDANPVPLPDAMATRVVAQEVLEHVDDPRQFLAESVSIGKPGALYFLSVPDLIAEKVQKTVAPEAYWRSSYRVDSLQAHSL